MTKKEEIEKWDRRIEKSLTHLAPVKEMEREERTENPTLVEDDTP